MDTPKTLAAQALSAADNVLTQESTAILLRAIAVYLDRLPAPDVGVGLTRYMLSELRDGGAAMLPDPNGQWVRYADVAPLLAAARAVPADVVLETTAEDLKAAHDRARRYDSDAILGRFARSHNTLTAALAASTAREKAKDAEIGGLTKVLEWYGSLPKEWLIKSAGLSYGDCHLLGEIARAALSGRKPDTKEGT